MEHCREPVSSHDHVALASSAVVPKKPTALGRSLKRILRSSMREIATEFLLGSFELFSYIPHCIVVMIRGCNRMWHRYYYGVNTLHTTEAMLYSQHIQDLVVPLLACGQNDHKKSPSAQQVQQEKICLSPEQRQFFVTRLNEYSDFVIKTLQAKKMHYAKTRTSFSEGFKKFSPCAWHILMTAGASSVAYIVYQAYARHAEHNVQQRAFQQQLRMTENVWGGHPNTIAFMYETYPYATSGYAYATYALLAGLTLYLLQSKVFIVPRPQEIIFHIDEIIATLHELQHAVCVPTIDNARVHCLLKGITHSFHQLGVLVEQGPLFDVPPSTEK